MSKKKKPVNIYKSQKEADAQKRKLFLKKLQMIFVGLGKAEAYKILSEAFKDNIYLYRFHTLHVMPDQSCQMPPELLAVCRNYFLRSYNNAPISFENPDFQISIGNYYEIFTSLLSSLNCDELAARYKEVATLRIVFSDYLKGESGNCRLEMGKKARDILEDTSLQFTTLTNSFTSIYWIEHKIVSQPEKIRNFDALIIHEAKAETKYFVVNDKKRTAYRLGWSSPFGNKGWASVTPNKLGIKCSLGDIPMDVYIQTHAIERIEERINNIPLGLSQYMIYLNVLAAQTITYKGQNFIVVHFSDIKVGYLLFSIIEGSILIRTFLLVTNSGTPEADKLDKLTGLGKIDKSFLNLDKLSSFTSEDYQNNIQIKQLLKSIGCEKLPKLREIIPDWPEANMPRCTAEMLEHYLEKYDDYNLGMRESEYMIND